MRSKKAIYNIITNLILQAVTILNGFVIPKIIINTFGSDANGLVTSITQFLGYITLLESGFGPVVKAVLYKAIAKKDKTAIADILKTSEKFFRRIALAFLAYIAILCVLFPIIIGNSFDTLFTITLIIIIAISTFAEYFFGMTYRLFLQSDQKMYIISITQTVTYVLSIGTVVLLTTIGSNLLIIKLASGAIFLLRPIVQNYYIKRKYNINLKKAKSTYTIEQKWDGLAQHIAAVIRDNTDVEVLTIFTTLEQVSVYSVYYLVVSGIRRVLLNMNSSLDASFGDMIAKKEENNLRNKFASYELIYLLIITSIFTCAFSLITPFVTIYTKGVTDADYIQPLFGYLLVLSGFVFAIMIPYSSITLAAGHFKETKVGAWIEAGTNIVISIALVNLMGLEGVAIGTVISMTIRSAELIYHANKYILKRSVWYSIKNIIISLIITLISSYVISITIKPMPNTYLEWIIQAAIIGTSIMIISIIIYTTFCREVAENARRQLIGIIKNAKTTKKRNLNG